MAATKHSKRTAADKTTTGRHTQDATSQAVPAETPTPAERAPVEVAEAASAPTAETTRIDTPVPTEGEIIAPDPTPPDEPAPVKKLSAVDAAARVLEETGQAMSCTELIAAMAAQGYWSSPKGRTPAGTLYSAVLREIQTKGDRARFRKTARGQFALRETV
jgi:HB1/ASXL restriction endonuclease-like protein with HTH domain